MLGKVVAGSRQSWRWPAIGIAIAGTVLLGLLLAGNGLIYPAWTAGPGAWLYRLAYLAILPAHLVVGVLSPPVDNHWPTVNWVLSSYLTAALGWLVWRGARRLWRWAGTAPASAPAPASALAPAPASALAPASASAPAPAPGWTRRQLLLGASTGTAAAAVGGVAGYGALIAPQRIRVRRYSVAIDGLPASLAGLRVVQLSDTHYGPFITPGYLREVVDLANRLGPDLILLTGDYVHRTPRSIRPGIELFAGLRPGLATLAVLGNHDHWEGAASCRRVFDELGIPLLDNRRMFVTERGVTDAAPERGGLCVGGLADLWEDSPSFEAALGGVPADMPRILMSHNPDVAETAPAEVRVDLLVAGHTHGGQIRLPVVGAPLVPSRYGDKYAGGMCQGPRGRVLVSRGVGMSILPVRLGVPPEISLIELTLRT